MTIAVIGLLSSQVGYDVDATKHLVLRGPPDFLTHDAVIELIDTTGAIAWRGKPEPWGNLWGSSWWVADFTSLRRHEVFVPRLIQAGAIRLIGDPLEISDQALFNRTAGPCSSGHLNKRKLLAKVRPGWFDAGSLWQLVNSHAPQIIGLCDLMRFAGTSLTTTERNACLQLINDGTTYLSLCRERAEQDGFGTGALVQCLAKIPDKVSPYDSFTAALAFALAAEVLLEDMPERSQACRNDAERCLDWALLKAKPLNHSGNVPSNQGFPDGNTSPNSWPTRSLMTAMYAEVVLCTLDTQRDRSRIDDLANQILDRQIFEKSAEQGTWGHFRAYADLEIAEKSWSHGMPIQDYNQTFEFGSDNGMVMAHPIFCFTEAIRRMPDHPQRERWTIAVRNFAQHYFKPMCLKSPFSILPRGFFGEAEPLWFAGVWHGCNTSYGIAAALAMEFDALTGDRAFRDIAYGNLQWIAGLNAGITREAIQTGCTISTTDVPEGVALAASMIHGVGRRTVGCWTNIRGSICNGFGTGQQFVYDVPARVSQDAPSALHDEDWITHNGGYLMGLARWHKRSPA